MMYICAWHAPELAPDRLIAAREIVQKALPNEALYGQMAKAGLPKGFAYEGRKAA